VEIVNTIKRFTKDYLKKPEPSSESTGTTTDTNIDPEEDTEIDPEEDTEIDPEEENEQKEG
jgi:hypothetical protein